MNKALKAVATTAAFVFVMASGAAAATCSGIGYTLTQAGTELMPVCGEPNEEGQTQYAPTNDWSLAGTYGGGEPTATGAALLLDGQNWSVTNSALYPMLAIALKQGSTFAFYNLDLSAVLSGTWFTAGPGGASNDYSHINLWVKGTPTTPPVPSPVPLPATAWLLLAGLGALVAKRRLG